MAAMLLAFAQAATVSDVVSPSLVSPFVRTAPPVSSFAFEANVGQFAPATEFVGRAGPLSVALSRHAITLQSRAPGDWASTATLRIAGASSVSPEASEPLAGKHHYFLGNDPLRWRTNVPTYGVVRYPNVGAGVDLVCHGAASGAFEYDLVVAPRARVEELAIDVEASGPVSVLPDGALSIPASPGAFVQSLPAAYQTNARGEKQPVAARYRVAGPGRFGFDVAPFDATRALVIDPILTTSTLLGGTSADSAAAVAVDSLGAVYTTGTTLVGFPSLPGAYQPSCAGGTDAFVAKLTADGKSLVYATYVGGSANDSGASIAVDSSGNAYIAGQTVSSDFPIANAIQASPLGVQAGFVAMLDPSGSMLVYSTYLGGSDMDTATGVAVDGAGSAYVTGQTQAASFPLADPLQSLIAGGTDAFVTKLAAGGGSLVYSTFVGGLHDDEGLGIALDADNDAYVTGGSFSPDFPSLGPIPSSGSGGAFLFEITADGTSLAYSACLGSAFDQGQGVAVDSSANAYMTGLTTSGLYPVENPLPGSSSLTGTNGFVTKITAGGGAIQYSTLLGGSDFDSATGIAVDALGDAFVTGYTYSTDYPTVSPLQTNPITIVNGIAAFVSEIAPDDSGFLYSTYLGGAGSTYGYGISMGLGAAVYVAGATGDLDFPTQNALEPAFPSSTAGSQGFVAELTAGSRTLLAISPSPASVPPLGSTTFHASGGSGSGYVFSLYADPSGGSIEPTTGVYRAGPHANVLDVIEVVDSTDTSAAAAVLVGTASLGDGGAEAGEGGIPDASARDARPPIDATPSADGSAADGSGAAVQAFAAEGSKCSYARERSPRDRFAMVVAALLAPLIGFARRVTRRRNPPRLESSHGVCASDNRALRRCHDEIRAVALGLGGRRASRGVRRHSKRDAGRRGRRGWWERRFLRRPRLRT
jgi:hypothetical protein